MEPYRLVWQRLNLKSAVMGRAKVLYGPLRELAIRRVPGINEEEPVNFLQLNRNLDAYLARIKADPEMEPAESEAFFAAPEMQRALPVPRFLEQQLLTYSKWRRESVGEGLVRRMLDYYREHLEIPRAREVVSGLEADLRNQEVRRWNQEDGQADPEGIPYYVRMTMLYRPFFRYWLNTAFYTTRDPESGTPLLDYLGKYLPYQEKWSRRFTEREDGTPRTITAAMGVVEIDCYSLHMEYRVNGRPVYRPCLSWEQTSQESDDWFAFLLPITAAPYSRFNEVAQEIFRRLDHFPVPGSDWALISRCLAGYVCCLPLNEETGKPVPPEKGLPLELSMEGGGKLYTAVWFEEGAPGSIFRQTFSGRRFQEPLTAGPGETRLEAAKRRLAELTSPSFFDLSRLRELPWHIYFTPTGGMEEELTNPELLKPEPRWMSSESWEAWDQEDGLPEREEEETEKDGRLAAVPASAGDPAGPESQPMPPERLVTAENLSAVLCRFSQDELDRVEMEWCQGRLVLRRDGDKYACLYFENSFGRGDYWYALLADAEMYQTVDCGDIVYAPFGMGKLAEYSIFRSTRDLLRDMDLVLGQMGCGKLESGGKSGWLWSCGVNLQDSKHKLLMAQQKLGGIPPLRGRNCHSAKFVLSRFPSELETVDLTGERTVTALRGGAYGLAPAGLVRFMMGKLNRIRISWTFKAQENKTELRHLVLLRDQGKYMMFWLQDGDGQALAYAADEPRWFLGRALPACLVHEDLRRLRNGIDLLLDDVDNTEPVLSQPGQFVKVRMPYEELRAELVSGDFK